MARVLLTGIFLLSLSSGLTQAATQEAECYGGQITGDQFPLDTYGFPFTPIYQGSFRGLSFLCDAYDPNCEAEGWKDFDKWKARSPYDVSQSIMGQCVYGSNNFCGDAALDTQICWSEAPFTLANTSNGETCVSTVNERGVKVSRDLTLYGISIDRRGAETKYCQIEFKTLATGSPFPEGPGTGSTRVIGLSPTDPETDQTPDGPTIPFPGYNDWVRQAVPFMPHFLLIGMAVLLATLGMRSVRRRKTA